MSETPHVPGESGSAPPSATPEADAVATTPAPYKNLFVPLVVVPAIIVGAIVVVFLFFGAITGEEASLAENLDRVVRGGAGDHTQAAFNMVRQIAENQEALTRGEPAPWPVEKNFPGKLRAAWEATPPDDHLIRMVIASLLAQLGDPDGVPRLLELLQIPEAEDPDGSVRFNALANLGAMGDERAIPAVIDFLERSSDEGLRSVAAIALQRLPGDATLAALRGALDDPSFDVRSNAAIGLAMRGDASGAKMLATLLDPATFAAEHDKDAKKYKQARRVSEARVQAIQALARLRRPEDKAAIAAVAEHDQDLAVREAAMRALEAWP